MNIIGNPWRKLSVRMRLTVWYSTVLSLTLLALGVFLYLFLSHNLHQEIDQSVANQANQVVRSITVVGEFPFPLSQVILPNVDVFASPDTYLQVVNDHGEILARSNNLGNQVLPLSRQTLLYAVKGKGFYETIEAGDQRLRTFNLPLTYRDQIIGILQVGRSLVPVDRALGRLSFVLFTGGLVTVLLAGMLGWFLAGMALRPIDRLIQAAADIQEARDLQSRIHYEGPADEIGELTATINDMLARLHGAYQSLEEGIATQKRFVSDASHELRTPLTTIRGNIELLQKMGDIDPEARREVLADIAGETERMTRLVNDLLALARADAGFKITKATLSLQEFLADLYRQVRLIPGQATFRGMDPAEVKGIQVTANPDYLKQLFLIIIDNAFKYTPAGGRVWLDTRQKPGFIGITVHDTGTGIAPEDIPKIFRRFYRADRARVGSGTGLGLAIANRIVEQHGGELEVESSPGVGSAFTVWLPNVFLA
ncbi:MAG: HAMP domain-containing histidine kinase [Firmicutes bacterium]|nr:HAMP domain-containing histidine kinase [Bacillota bacterium]